MRRPLIVVAVGRLRASLLIWRSRIEQWPADGRSGTLTLQPDR